MNLEEIEKRISRIEKRNESVEHDKAWETSLSRKLLLIVFTYIAIGLYLSAIRVPSPWLNSIVPALGFYLSTLSLPYFRKIWERYKK